MDETALVLAASGLVPAAEAESSGIRTTVVVAVAGLWLGLAGALLLVAFVTPFVAAAAGLNKRRGQFALIGANMVVAAAVGYLVVAAS